MCLKLKWCESCSSYIDLAGGSSSCTELAGGSSSCTDLAGGSSLQPTACTKRECDHSWAYKWVQCKKCCRWEHCVCVGVLPKTASCSTFEYIRDFCMYGRLQKK